MENKYEIYRKCIPIYLENDINEYLKYKDDKTYTIIDCLIDKIYGYINSALYSDEITKEQANKRQRYGRFFEK